MTKTVPAPGDQQEGDGEGGVAERVANHVVSQVRAKEAHGVVGCARVDFARYFRRIVGEHRQQQENPECHEKETENLLLPLTSRFLTTFQQMKTTL